MAELADAPDLKSVEKEQSRVGSSPTTRIGVKFCCDSNFQLCFILSVEHDMNRNSVSVSAVATGTLTEINSVG